MPVLSEPYTHAAMGAPIFLLAFAVLSLCSFVIRRCTRAKSSILKPSQSPILPEKEPEFTQYEDQQGLQEKGLTAATNRIQRPPQPPPFTPPEPLIATQDLAFGGGTNASYYDSPMTGSPIISTFDSFEAEGFDFPRRRSYTKTTAGGVEVHGEVVMAEGWRRHTKVFGGGVCMACEESERRMTA